MLRQHGETTVTLSKVKGPGDLRARQKTQHVKDLADSLKHTGGVPLQRITVDRKSRELVAGRDRFAAMLLAGVKRAPALMVSGSELDIRRATAIENFHRRADDRQKLAAELVKLELEEQGGPDDADKPTRGAKARAVEAVAAQLQTTPKAVERLVERHDEKAQGKPKKPKAPKAPKAAKAAPAEEKPATADTPPPSVTAAATASWGGEEAEAEEAAPAEPAAPAAPPALPTVVLQTYGDPIPPEVQDEADRLAAALKDIRGTLAKVAGQLTKVEGETGRQLIRMREGLQQAAFEAKAEIPFAVCPTCKLAPIPRASCNGCGGRGYVGQVYFKGVGEELQAGGDKAVIFYNGKRLTLAEAKALR